MDLPRRVEDRAVPANDDKQRAGRRDIRQTAVREILRQRLILLVGKNGTVAGLKAVFIQNPADTAAEFTVFVAEGIRADCDHSIPPGV